MSSRFEGGINQGTPHRREGHASTPPMRNFDYESAVQRARDIMATRENIARLDKEIRVLEDSLHVAGDTHDHEELVRLQGEKASAEAQLAALIHPPQSPQKH